MKIMTTIMYSGSLTKSQSMRSKRKSAVELLAESKPFYVKSEIVRDNTQKLPTRAPLLMAKGINNYVRSKSVKNVTTSNYYNNNIIINNGGGKFAASKNYQTQTTKYIMAVSPSRSLPPLNHQNKRRSLNNSSTTDLLQNRLRQLLVSDSAEELRIDQAPLLSPPAEYSSTHQRCHKSLPDLHCRGGGNEPNSNKSSNKSLSNRDSGGSSGYTHRSEPPAPPIQFCSPIDIDTRRDSGSSTQHSSGISPYYCCQEPECSRQNGYLSTTFKRQKCLRYSKKERPILRSKSDISDRYWRPPEPPNEINFDQFFDQLGLTSERYADMLSGSGHSTDSPVFFSDISTVDSSRPLDNSLDSCPTNYRNSEPTSIVERNARIIKWLCNCRKYQ